MLHPIGTPILLRQLDDLFQQLLQSLSPEDWQRQTVAKKWKVKAVVAHLLDGNIRSLSMLRDGYFGTQPQREEPLLGFLNRLNAEWVTAMERVSPEVLIALHRWSGPEYCDYIASLDPEEKAVFAVDWAGERESTNRMHIAREYTEKWIHQQQIRDTLGDDLLLGERYFLPFINTFMLGMPHSLRSMLRPAGQGLKVEVSGKFPMIWYLVREGERWRFIEKQPTPLSASVKVPDTIAWKLFSKSVRPAEVIKEVETKGDEKLARAALGMVSVMA